MSDTEKIKKLESEINQLKEKINQLEEENDSLQHKSFLLQALMDNFTDTIYFKDIKSRFTLISKQQAKLLGLKSVEEAVGKTDFDFFTKEHAQEAFKDEQEVIKTGKPMSNKLERIRNAEGHFRWVSASKVPFTNDKGKIIGLVGMSKDLTDTVEAQEKVKAYAEELRLLNITKDKFFSIIAHDLKNPFNTILGFSSILMAEFDEMNNLEKREFLSQIDKVSHYAYQLLENLLQWARSQTGRIAFNPVKCDLSKLIKENVDALSIIANKKQITIKSEVKHKSIADVDVNMINTSLRNIISNAIKFSRPGGSVIVTASKNGDFWEIIVKDSGIGIPKTNLSKLFKVDEHISTTGTNDEKGTGLGLILCNEFVKAHNGSITVTSKENEGTSVKVSIPVKQNIPEPVIKN